MLCNKEFAKGLMSKTEKGKENWGLLSNNLNSLGPPIHDEEGWLKVYKYNDNNNV